MYVYRLSDSINGAELQALGEVLDACCGLAEEQDQECTVPTAAGYGLSGYEALMPYVPVYADLETRRGAIMALLQIDDTSFTKDALNKTLAGCGIPALVEETGEWYTIAVQFPGVRGKPEKEEQLRARIEEILPCHLRIIYTYVYICWRELEMLTYTWQALERAGMTWNMLERLTA